MTNLTKSKLGKKNVSTLVSACFKMVKFLNHSCFRNLFAIFILIEM